MKAATNKYSKVDVLQATKRDSIILMTLWYMRKTFYALIFFGLAGAIHTGSSQDTSINWLDINDVLAKLSSPIAGLVLAVLVRLTVNSLALLTAYPVLSSYQDKIKTRYGNPLVRLLDDLQMLKGLRRLRWTHHVRLKAMQQFDTEFFRSGKLNTIFDGINIASFLVLLYVIVFASHSS